MTIAGDGCLTTLVKVTATYKGPYGVATRVEVTPNAAGAWSTTLTLPGPPLPGAVIPITAVCAQRVLVQQVLFGYAEGRFVVTDASGRVPTMSVTPRRPVGTAVSVSGGGCQDGSSSQVRVLLRVSPVTDPLTAPVFGFAFVSPGSDGRWSATLTVIDTLAPGVDPVGDRMITAECGQLIVGGGYLTAFTYPQVPFAVTSATGHAVTPTTLPTAPTARARQGPIRFTG